MRSYSRPCFLFCSGYPDHATRNLLKALIATRSTTATPLPLFVVTDADPHGVAIAMCYAEALRYPGLHWIGVYPSHRGTLLPLPSSTLLPLTAREHGVAQQILNKSSVDIPSLHHFFADARRELSVLLASGVKFEMEALAALQHDGQNALLDYIVARISEILQ